MRAGAGAPAALALRAPAKINLFLHVTGRRADGYHRLDSLVAFTEAGDDLAVAPSDGFALAVDGPFAAELGGDPEDNLVLRAARRLAEAAGVSAGASFRLTKNLPVASGIGGGSADAAAALRLLPRLWGATVDEGRLAALGLTLGADVPVCLAGRPTRMGGIGEVLDPVPALPDCGVLLVNPGVPVATSAVFRLCRPLAGGPAALPPVGADAAGLAAALAACRNDLEAPAMTVAPAIGDVLGALRGAAGCRFARLSGSGATCFGLFDGAGDAEAAAAAIRAAHPGWWACETRFRRTPPGIAPG